MRVYESLINSWNYYENKLNMFFLFLFLTLLYMFMNLYHFGSLMAPWCLAKELELAPRMCFWATDLERMHHKTTTNVWARNPHGQHTQQCKDADAQKQSPAIVCMRVCVIICVYVFETYWAHARVCIYNRYLHTCIHWYIYDMLLHIHIYVYIFVPNICKHTLFHVYICVYFVLLMAIDRCP